MEIGYTCKLCGWYEAWTKEVCAKAAAIWHLHDHHPEAFIAAFGGEAPQSPRPDDIAREYGCMRYEEWELQGRPPVFWDATGTY